MTRITGFTLAVTRMEQTIDFYTHVFGISFEAKELYGDKLYYGDWEGIEICLCPASLAKNTAKQNRHQLEVLVAHIEKTMELVVRYGGRSMGAIEEIENTISMGIYDPDNNSLVLKQVKK
ncbi:MAG: VOC family protein [Bacteroidota bacterium]